MPRRSFSRFACSLARTLDVIGDTWTPLIIRDAFLGVDTFNDLVRDLGISRALLAARLELLVREEILREDRYQEHPPRMRYVLTARGLELVPILITLTQWGDRWQSAGEPPLLFDHDCGAPLSAMITCEACGEPVSAETVYTRPGQADATHQERSYSRNG